MTSTALQTALERMQAALDYDGEDLNERFHSALDALATTDDPDTPYEMFLVFDDHYEFQDFMWVLLHRVETFAMGPYVAAYFRVVVALYVKAPEWAERVLLRCLNGDPYRQAVADALATASESQANVTGAMCKNPVRDHPARFAAKVATLPLRR